MIKEIELTISEYVDMAHTHYEKTGDFWFVDAYAAGKSSHKIIKNKGVNWIYLNTTDVGNEKVLAAKVNGNITHYILTDYYERSVLSIQHEYQIIMNLDKNFIYKNSMIKEPEGDGTYFNCVIRTSKELVNDNIKYFKCLFVR